MQKTPKAFIIIFVSANKKESFLVPVNYPFASRYMTDISLKVLMAKATRSSGRGEKSGSRASILRRRGRSPRPLAI
jgi:hypothetical protein